VITAEPEPIATAQTDPPSETLIVLIADKNPPFCRLSLAAILSDFGIIT
jgi:hypothetical protein